MPDERRDERERGGDAVRRAPAGGREGLLAPPYLPWLPDALPILRLLAGPGRALVWFTIFALIARGFWRALPRRVASGRCAAARRRRSRCSSSARLISGAHGHRLHAHDPVSGRRRAALSGHRAEPVARRRSEDREQPHARGLSRILRRRPAPALPAARDGSRDLFDPPDRRVRAADAHLRARRLHAGGVDDGGDGERGGRAGVAAGVSHERIAHGGDDGVAGVLRERTVGVQQLRRLSGSAGRARGDVRVAGDDRPDRRSRNGIGNGNGTWLRWMLCGVAIATLPWFSTKYVLMAGAITAIALGRLWWPEICPKNNRFAIARVGGPADADRDQPRGLAHVLLRDLGHVLAGGAVRLAARDEARLSAGGRAGAAVRSGIRRDRVRARAVPRADRPRRDARDARTRAAARAGDPVRGAACCSARSARSTSGGAAARRSDGRSSRACCCSRSRSRIASNSSARNPR